MPEASGRSGTARFVLGQRLYLRFYLALLASLAIAATLFGLAHWRFDPSQVAANPVLFADLATAVLPPVSAPAAEQRTALQRWSKKVHADLALYAPDRVLVASAGQSLPALDPQQASSGWLEDSVTIFVLKLADGRWLEYQRWQPHRAVLGLVVLLALIAAVVAAGAYPVVRRLTGRLERLQGSVEIWGEGRLSTRVAVEGADEVARLATSFNDAAARIEALVGAQKSLLANASHELRSPLARIRMAIELMQERVTPGIRDELKRNVAELDQLIDEVLLASRLDAAGGAAPVGEQVSGQLDFTAVLAEECARVNATLTAAALSVQGDPKLLRRMVRNLLENAGRYGAGSPVEVDLRRAGGALELDVSDGGPGICEDERERIFEPFYRVPGASEAAGGVGLGLSLVRQIARHHGGRVECLPRKGGGCCFRVTLPGAR